MFKVYSTKTCGYCKMAQSLLEQRGHNFDVVTLMSPADVVALSEKVGHEVRTVPQIWHDDQYIGGYDQLREYLK